MFIRIFERSEEGTLLRIMTGMAGSSVRLETVQSYNQEATETPDGISAFGFISGTDNIAKLAELLAASAAGTLPETAWLETVGVKPPDSEEKSCGTGAYLLVATPTAEDSENHVWYALNGQTIDAFCLWATEALIAIGRHRLGEAEPDCAAETEPDDEPADEAEPLAEAA
jgi:hypothetical protein